MTLSANKPVTDLWVERDGLKTQIACTEDDVRKSQMYARIQDIVFLIWATRSASCEDMRCKMLLLNEVSQTLNPDDQSMLTLIRNLTKSILDDMNYVSAQGMVKFYSFWQQHHSEVILATNNNVKEA